MSIVLDGTTGLAGAATGALNGTLGATTPSTVAATTITASTPIGVASGGTGAATLTANNVLLGNGTSAVQVVAPGTSGNVLTSNGTTWASTALPAGGVTSLNGQTGAITNTSLYAIGSYITGRPANITNYAVDSTIAGSSLYATSLNSLYTTTWGVAASPTLVNTGTWRCMSPAPNWNTSNGGGGLWVRIS